MGLKSILGACALIVFGYLIGAVRIVREGDEAIVERLGQYQRTLKPGLNFVVPLYDEITISSVRERAINFVVSAVTEDDIPLDLNITLFSQVADVFSMKYRVENIEEFIKYTLQSRVISEVAQYPSQEIFKAVDDLNFILKSSLESELSSYGIKIVKVSIQQVLLSGIIRESPNVIQFTFLNGVQWVAFRDSFRLIVENDGISLEVQGVEELGDGVFKVKVRVPSDTDEAGKVGIYKKFMKKYEENQQIGNATYSTIPETNTSDMAMNHEHQTTRMLAIIETLANRPSPPVNLNQNINQNTGDNPMTTQDNQAIATGANSNINFGTQTGNTLNFGTISGNLTNSLTQLVTQPQTQAIAAHLKEFQTAIEGDPHLPEPDKIDALEQVATLAEASKDPAKPENANLTRKAMKLLKGTIDAVPKATSFIEACTKLLPLISKFFGL
jgi:SPFH domain / Band 7 family